jgi:hypothetical protein
VPRFQDSEKSANEAYRYCSNIKRDAIQGQQRPLFTGYHQASAKASRQNEID